jgi:pimeloyl-ACP methyl ester carboxylesterase
MVARSRVRAHRRLAADLARGTGSPQARRCDSAPAVVAKSSNVTQATARAAALTFCNALPTAAILAMSRSGPPRNGSTPTVLLVHEAFADGSMWADVITELQSADIEAIALANPLRSVASDAAYIAHAATQIDGPVLLAGHGYGGAVITATGALAGNVGGLVYVAGFALDVGESALDITGRFPGSQLLSALRPATFPGVNGDPAVELYFDREAYPQLFAADLSYRRAAAAAAVQRPITAAAFEEKALVAAWKKTPSWYMVATADQLIPPQTQRFMAQRAGAHAIEIAASHAITLTQSAAVAGQIAAASRASHPQADTPTRSRGARTPS